VPIRPVGFCNVNEMFEINTGQADSIGTLRGPSTSLYATRCRTPRVDYLDMALRRDSWAICALRRPPVQAQPASWLLAEPCQLARQCRDLSDDQQRR